MNVLVVGGDGFLGSHLVEALVRAGHDVAVLDRFPDGTSRHLKAVEDRVRLVSGDLSARGPAEEALAGREVVFHFACATNPVASWNDIPLEIEENLRPSILLFERAAAAGVRKIVFPSSGGTVYGRQEGRLTEERVPLPVSPYGIFKLTTEHLLRHFGGKCGLAADVYRIANAYGPRQPVASGQGVIAIWMRQIVEGRVVHVYGDERTRRDYVHVGDVAALMQHSLRDLSASDVYNLGTGRGTSVLELLDIFRRRVHASFPCERHPRRPSDAEASVLDSGKLLSHFPGFRFAELEDKIGETWDDFRARFRAEAAP